MQSTADRAGQQEARGYVLVVLTLALTAASLAVERTNVVPAFPTIERDLHAPTTWTAWLLTGPLILSCIAAPTAGKLGDMFGKSRLLFISLLVLFLGDIGAALAPSIWILIVFRSLQGIGGGVLALAFSLTRDKLPPEKVGQGIGIITGAFGVGGAIGYSTSGFIVQALSWRFVIATGAFILLVAVLLARFFVAETDSRSQSTFDVPGMALFGGALACLLIALTQSQQWGWLAPPTLLLFVAAVALFVGYGYRELHTDDPLLDLHILTRRPVLFANLASLLAAYAYFGLLIMLPHLVEAPNHAPPQLRAQVHYGLGLTVVGAGLLLVPISIGILIAGPLSGWLGRRRGPKRPFAAGMVLLAAGSAVLALWHGQIWQIVVGVLLVGLGFGAQTGSAGTIVSQAVDETQSGVATGMNSVSRLVGGGIGGQVAAAILASMTIGGTLVPAEGAFTAAFWAGAALALLGAILVACIPARQISG